MIEKFEQDLNWIDASIDTFPTLRHDEIHLWWLPLQLNPEQIDSALALLSDIQRDKYHRRATDKLKRNYLAGRFYLLSLLGAYVGQKPAEVLLSYSRLNKPRLSDRSLGIEFNFTDTEGYGVYAFSKSRQVGVDLESRFREIDFEAIAERRFTQTELDFVYQDGTLNTQRCIGIWTRKEAFGKASGMGINFKMNQRNLYQSGLDGEPSHEIKFTDDAAIPWRCLQLQLGDNFIASVVHEHHSELELKAYRSLQT
jgi:phosphopantetheinyl transferase